MTLSKEQISVKQMGHDIECKLASGNTPKPGQVVKLGSAASDEYAVGHTSLQLNVLKENNLVGKTVDDAYVAGERALAFNPVSGDEWFALALSGETITKGEEVGYDATSGKVEAAETGLIAMEGSGGALAADTLLLVKKI